MDAKEMFEKFDDIDFLNKCVLYLYSLQTKTEKSCEQTIDLNGVGFNAFDSKTLSHYAEWLLNPTKSMFSVYHELKVKKMMKKYIKNQLLRGYDCGYLV